MHKFLNKSKNLNTLFMDADLNVIGSRYKTTTFPDGSEETTVAPRMVVG
jgi:hypothetical protein